MRRLAEIQRCIERSCDCMLERFERNGRAYPFADLKFDARPDGISMKRMNRSSQTRNTLFGMRDYKCDIFAKSAWFCKCLATKGNQTRARLRNQSKNAEFVIYHDEKRITSRGASFR